MIMKKYSQVIAIFCAACLNFGLSSQTIVWAQKTTSATTDIEAAATNENTDENAEQSDAGTSGGMASSATVWEYNGEIYTVDNVRKDGFHSVSGEYKDTMAVYGDKIYLRKTAVSSDSASEIIEMDMNEANQKVLTNSAKPNARFCIYNNYLYYTSGDGKKNYDGRKIDLSTGEDTTSGAYVWRGGSDKVWVSTGIEDNKWYISGPGFADIKEDTEIQGSLLGVVGSKICYMYQNNDTWTTCIYDAEAGKRITFQKENASKSCVSGSGLYYKTVADGNTVLHRKDLNDGSEEQYDLGDFNLYMGGGLNEVSDRLFLLQFKPDQGEHNTEMWQLSRQDGTKECIAYWYNENSKNAAKEP